MSIGTSAPAPPQSSEGFEKRAQELLQAPPVTHRSANIGDVDAALKSSAKQLEATYQFPFIAHVTLEPQGATAHFKDGKLEMWTIQHPAHRWSRLIAKSLSIQESDITTHMVRGGGSFGRRLQNDYAVEAAWIAKQIDAPVKLLWSREDDVMHDPFRPGGTVGLKGGVDAKGKLTAWRHHLITYGDEKHTAPGGDMGPDSYPLAFVPASRSTHRRSRSSCVAARCVRPETMPTAGWRSRSSTSWRTPPAATRSSSNSNCSATSPLRGLASLRRA